MDDWISSDPTATFFVLGPSRSLLLTTSGEAPAPDQRTMPLNVTFTLPAIKAKGSNGGRPHEDLRTLLGLHPHAFRGLLS